MPMRDKIGCGASGSDRPFPTMRAIRRVALASAVGGLLVVCALILRRARTDRSPPRDADSPPVAAIVPMEAQATSPPSLISSLFLSLEQPGTSARGAAATLRALLPDLCADSLAASDRDTLARAIRCADGDTALDLMHVAATLGLAIPDVIERTGHLIDTRDGKSLAALDCVGLVRGHDSRADQLLVIAIEAACARSDPALMAAATRPKTSECGRLGRPGSRRSN